MEIDLNNGYQKALNKKIDVRIGMDDETITYQEFFLYYMFYFEIGSDTKKADVDLLYKKYKDSWISETWKKMKAAKFQKAEILIPWDEVF